jgi:two-component sensor histidine kinase
MLRMLPISARGTASIRAWFAAIAVIGAISALIIGALAGWYSWEQQKLRFGQGLMATSRALIQSSDRELEQSAVVLRALSGSESFRKGDLATFRTRASDFLSPYGYFLLVSELGSSRILMNAAMPNGSSLPQLPPDWITNGRGADELKVKPLSKIGDEQWAVAVQTIAAADNGSKYLLTLGVPTSRFQRVINDQGFPPESFPVILDQNWTIVARYPYKFVGRKGANDQLKDIPPPDSVYEAEVLEGTPTLAGRSRSEIFGWTVAIGIPKAALATQFIGPAIVAGLSGFLISLLAAGAIGLLSMRLGRDIDALSRATAALAEHKVFVLPKFQVRELAAAAENMKNAAERLSTEENFRERLVAELAHRLRNKLATIQAIVGYELRGNPQSRDAIFSRLAALSATDELVIAAQGRGADLREIIETEMAPYHALRVSADGPGLFLEPKRALTMALVLHELATNASKYGSLSGISGNVSILWSIAGNQLNLEWRESGGPIVVKPERHGFGSRLVTGILASFDGKIDARFEPTGLVCHVAIGLEAKTATALPKFGDDIIVSTAVQMLATASGTEERREAS